MDARKKLPLLIITFCIINVVIYTQSVPPNQIKFHHLDANLSHNTATNILQDSKGFLWFGTFDGLNRYDGDKVITYKNNPLDSATLTNSRIHGMTVDNNDDIWIGTDEGLSRYNYIYDNFTQFFNDPDDTASITSGYVSEVIFDKKGRIWAASEELCLYLPETNNFKRYNSKQTSQSEQRSNLYNFVYEDNSGRIWFGCFKELYYLDEEKDELILFYDGNENPLVSSDWHFLDMIQVNRNEFWLTSENAGIIIGDFYKSNKLKTFTDFNFFDSKELNAKNILTIYKDSQERIWVSVENEGVYIFDVYKRLLHRLYSDPNDDYSISFNSVWKVFEDNAGRYWIGTWESGIDFIDPNYTKFGHYNYKKGVNSLSNNAVRDIIEDEHGNLYIATDGGGLNYFDRSTGKFTVYMHDPDDPTSISVNATLPLEFDDKGMLWIGTWNGGVNIFDPDAKTFTQLLPSNSGLSSRNIFGILNDGHGRMYMSTWGGGVCFYDQVTNEWYTYRFEPDKNSIQSDLNFSVSVTSNGDIFVGSSEGLDVIKPGILGEQEILNYALNINDPNALSNNTVQFIYEDVHQNIWIGTQGGLNLYNQDEGNFTVFHKDESIGFLNDAINCMVHDNNDNYWLGTNKGLIKFTYGDSISFRPYDLTDGIQSYQYSRGSHLKLQSGEVVMGGTNGFNIFNPDSVKDNPKVPNIVLTDFRIFYKKVPISDDSPLQKHICETKSIKLSHKQSVLSFSYVALNYTHPEKNKYAYMMEGFEDDWNYVGNNLTATYTNLSAGEYKFRVKASNNDGVWNNEGVELDIVITPPFWKTWWFISLVVFGIIYAVFRLFKIREEKAKRDKLLLEQKIREGEAIVEKHRTEVEVQKEEIRKREENEKEIRFQTNGLAKFSEILSENKDNLEKLWQTVISELVKFVGANLGVLYILKEESEDDSQHFLELAGAFACDAEKLKQTRFHIHEGYIGACFREGKVVELDKIPESYTHVSSGLGSRKPEYSVLIPIKQDEIRNGVIEIASFNKLEKYKVNFLELLSKSLSSHITIINANATSQLMLERSNMQAEEMRAQEEEMRQNLEEMMATQEEMTRQKELWREKESFFRSKEVELKNAIDKLQKENYELRKEYG